MLKRSFVLDDTSLEHPYFKAKWNGSMELFLNDVLVKRIEGNVSDYCGLYVPEAAAKALKKGKNVIEVKAILPNSQITMDIGVIDWTVPVSSAGKTQHD